MLSFKAFLNEDYKTTAVKFVASGIDKAQVDEYIKKFRELSNKQKLSGEEKNIDTWAKKTFLDFKNFVDAKEKEVAESSVKKDSGKKIDITTETQRKNGWNIIIPLDKEASCFYGTGTDWCVSKRNKDYFNQYFYNTGAVNLIFCLNNKKQKWAITIPTEMEDEILIYDNEDATISQEEFEDQTDLSLNEIINNHSRVAAKIKTHKDTNPEHSNGYLASTYAIENLEGRFPAGEAAISTLPKQYREHYADFVKKSEKK